MNRRNFLRGLGIASVGLAVVGVSPAPARRRIYLKRGEELRGKEFEGDVEIYAEGHNVIAGNVVRGGTMSISGGTSSIIRGNVVIGHYKGTGIAIGSGAPAIVGTDDSRRRLIGRRERRPEGVRWYSA